MSATVIVSDSHIVTASTEGCANRLVIEVMGGAFDDHTRLVLDRLDALTLHRLAKDVAIAAESRPLTAAERRELDEDEDER